MSGADKYISDGRIAYDSKAMSLSCFALRLLILLLWVDRILLEYFRAVFMRLPFIGSMADFIIYGVYILLIILALPGIFRNMRAIDFIGGLIVFVVCILNFLLFPDNAETLEENLPVFLLYTFPLYYVGLSLDFQKIYPWLYKLSLVTIVAFTIYKLFINEPMDETQSLYQGDMWGSYNFLPHVGVVAMRMLKKPNILNVSLSVIGIFMIAFLGSRGPLFCILLMIALYLFMFKKYKHPVLVKVSFLCLAALVLIGLDAIMLFLYDLSDNLGLSIRIFEKYFDGGLTDSTGRDNIQEALFALIQENPIVGHGLFADITATGSYAHNIVIELWVEFGLLLGTGIFIWLTCIIIKPILKWRQLHDWGLLILPLFVSGFVKLFLSGSYLNEIYLFLLLGICVNWQRWHKAKYLSVKDAI